MSHVRYHGRGLYLEPAQKQRYRSCTRVPVLTAQRSPPRRPNPGAGCNLQRASETGRNRSRMNTYAKCAATPVESSLPKSLDLKSRAMNTYKKWGEGQAYCYPAAGLGSTCSPRKFAYSFLRARSRWRCRRRAPLCTVSGTFLLFASALRSCALISGSK